eukprot:1161739-Pelagomonas_calceolata.AAC.10
MTLALDMCQVRSRYQKLDNAIIEASLALSRSSCQYRSKICRLTFKPLKVSNYPVRAAVGHRNLSARVLGCRPTLATLFGHCREPLASLLVGEPSLMHTAVWLAQPFLGKETLSFPFCAQSMFSLQSPSALLLLHVCPFSCLIELNSEPPGVPIAPPQFLSPDLYMLHSFQC